MTTEVSFSEPIEHADSPSAPEASRQSARDDDEISLLDLFIVLAERKRIILWVTAVFAIVAIVASFLLPKRYTATVILLPPQQNTSLASTLTSQLGNLGSLAALAGGSSSLLKNPNDMYVAMFKSRTVEDAMIQRFGLMQEYDRRYLSDTRKKFEHYTDVNGSGKDTLIHITVEDRDPRRAAELANGYVDQFRNLSQHLAITEASQRRLFFEQQLAQAKDNLANAEETMKQTEQTTGLIEVDSQARALIAAAASLRAEVVAKEVQIQAMQTYATGQNAQLVEAQQELDSLRAQLAKLGGTENDATGFVVPKGKVPQASLEYLRKLRDVKYYETIFEILARQFELAKLDEAKEGALIQVVDPAIPPDKRSFPKRGLIVIIATFAGLLSGILFVLLQAGFEHKKHEPEIRAKLSLLRQFCSLK